MNEARLSTNVLIAKYMCAVFLLGGIGLLALTALFSDQAVSNLYTQIGAIFSFLSILFYLQFGARQLLGIRVLSVFLILYIPLRCVQTGGIYSPFIFAYLAHTIYVGAIYGIGPGLIMVAWSLLSILAFGSRTLPAAVSEPTMVEVFSVAILLLGAVAPIVLILDASERMVGRIQQFERQRSSRVILKSLGNKAEGLLIQGQAELRNAAMERSEQRLNLAQKHCLQLDALVKRMGDLAEKGELSFRLRENGS